MSTNRRTKRRGAKPGITPEAIAAWQAADFRALHRALGLAPWEPSPLPREIIALGCSQDDEVDADSGRCWDQALPKALAIQRKLLKVAGWPECREAYAANLREAREWATYCRGLVKHPDRCHRGTSTDLPTLREKLRDAEGEVAYRKKLLDELD
jgi:plasmid stabilization system protein ParE